MLFRCGFVIVAMVTLATGIGAQAVRKVTFEVASIREDRSPQLPSVRLLPDRVEINNQPLSSLVMLAFESPGPSVISPSSGITGPAWLNAGDAKRFVIRATMPAGASRAQFPAMLRSLLSDRFGLVSHVESRTVPVYELTVQSGGPKMREVEPVDELTKEFKSSGTTKVRVDITTDVPTFSGPLAPQRVIDTNDGTRVITADSLYVLRSIPGRPATELDAIRMRIGELIGRLSGASPRPIIDKTGLKGLYQFKIELPERIAIGPNGQPVEKDPVAMPVFKTVETLGLKLRESRAVLDFRVIDKVERMPTDN